MKLIVRAACAFAFVSTTALAATVASAPPTARGDTFDIVQGVRVDDPYRWLEDANDPKVQAWSDAQNARTRDYLDALSTRTSVKQQLTTLITATSPAYSALEARGPVVFALYNDPAMQQPMLVTLNAQADPASRKVLLDPNALDAKGLTAMDWFVPSADGSKVAVSLSKNGSEDGTLHVYDVATGHEIDRADSVACNIPTAGGSLAWSKDGKGFWYTRYPGADAPEADRHFNMQVYYPSAGHGCESRSAGARRERRPRARLRSVSHQPLWPRCGARVGAAGRRR